MSDEELDAFLRLERVCRCATVSGDGQPHVSPLWFVWDSKYLWLNSVVKSRRWADIRASPQASVVIDTGHEYSELRGVELRGELEQVGAAPRGAEIEPDLDLAERLYARKYQNAETFNPDGRHGWLRLVPNQILSWDFRKLASLQ